MARGTGLKGVVGLRPSNGDIVRPLLFCDMQRIMDYVTINMVTFMEDETNLDTSFDRNSVRLKIVPELKRLNPSFNEAMWRFFENLYDGYSIVEKDIMEALSSFETIDGILFVENVRLKGMYRALLFETVREIVSKMSSDGYPPSRERIEAFYDLLMSERNGWTVEFREDLKGSRLESVEVFSLPFEISLGGWRLRIREGKKLSGRLDGRFLSVCGIRRMALPLKLRPADKKDYIVPFGMSGTKRIERIVSEKGLKGFWSKLLILENARGEILWVPGIVTSELCRADPSYTELVVFSLERR
jgi:tRNA(Ile)-lysidine synthase